MSVFVDLKESPTVLRCFGPEHRFTGQYGPRYARLCINRSSGAVEVWSYSYPVQKQLPIDVTERDIHVTQTGYGKERRVILQSVEEPSPIDVADAVLIQRNRLVLREVCK